MVETELGSPSLVLILECSQVQCGHYLLGYLSDLSSVRTRTLRGVSLGMPTMIFDFFYLKNLFRGEN